MNYREPAREYDVVPIKGWTVQVERELLSEDPAPAKQALPQLEQEMDEGYSTIQKL